MKVLISRVHSFFRKSMFLPTALKKLDLSFARATLGTQLFFRPRARSPDSQLWSRCIRPELFWDCLISFQHLVRQFSQPVVKWFVFFQLLSWVILEIHQVIFAAVSAPVSCVPKTGWQEVIPKPEPLMDQLLERCAQKWNTSVRPGIADEIPRS